MTERNYSLFKFNLWKSAVHVCFQNSALLLLACFLLPAVHTWKNDATTEKIVSTSKVPEITTSSVTISTIVCDVGGKNICGTNEECKAIDKTKNGHCECKTGFQRNSDNVCNELHVTSAFSSTSSTVSTTGTSNSGNNSGTSTTSKNSSAVTIPVTTTTTTTTTKAPAIQQLTVSAGKNKILRLPQKEVQLSAFVVPVAEKDEEYHYKWSVIHFPEGAEKGSMSGPDSPTFTLKDLVLGLYTLKVDVIGKNKAGEAAVNITVIPPKRTNKPPVAIIKPTSLKVKLPKSAILDGSESTDDVKIVKYKWEEISGPINDRPIEGNKSMLKLNQLEPGEYQFKLTVIDSDGATNSTTANVTAIKETDYKPTANAGSDIVINLPQNYVTLYGNASTDDKGIKSYEWTKAPDGQLAADMMGVRTPFLNLSNLEEGNYKFTLKVTDTGGQTATADVHVFVKPEVNHPPKASTAGELTVSLPVPSLVLDGHNSTDDKGIVKYLWEQVSGPKLTLSNTDRNIATATGDIKVGIYVFKLTVYDMQGQTGSTTLKITVKQNENKPPVADAGGDKVIILPQNMVSVDGSRSKDDHKIVRYQWTREPDSLAAGDVANNSNHQAVLQLVNLIAGRYIFSLQVFDAEGLSSSDSASIIVKKNHNQINQMVLELDTDLSHFTQKSLTNMESQLALLLHKSSSEGDSVIKTQKIFEDPSSGHLKMVFYALTVMKDSQNFKRGIDVLHNLRPKLYSQPDIFEYPVVSIDTLVCQNNCSGHGRCDQHTKQCMCEAFWMQDFIRTKLLHGENNCDWSILYVVIVCFLIVVGTAGISWAICCCWKKRRCRWRTKKRSKYSLLPQIDAGKDSPDVYSKTRLKAFSGPLHTDSVISSEEDTLFINHKKPNGQIRPKNGLTQHTRNQMK
ncbi:Dyslexia-associated protein KIAA0319-like protein,Dyslexia-associated protein KIAA0319 [Acanthosepion pharaonis]|uniref:Dyslexia-associated protein KIAA0319-like protein,Dyslexia-associated protein KIAA0319 n=1 Tax=Acanthosepion pharaonis TaxID=158019 RepID=A0A812C0J3_ACAPH|nr:Dyslexia-associated protein KIAA0319-like protein,Dyslexia-associated protein KIAA0319 [Sepia pharaonis]